MSTNEGMSNANIQKPEQLSVLSSNPEERILARRIRIQKRSEALRKQVGIEDEEIAEETRTEKQIEASNEMMEKLVTEGAEVISNIRVANDAREIHRREEDIAIRNALLIKLEEEAQESTKKYEEISSKWSGILASKDPLDIHADIESQNAKCRKVLEQKDILIAELKRELDNADQRFADDQKLQNEDINILIERIDNQTNIISKAYRRELLLIEDVLKNERKEILQNITKKWNDLYNERQSNEMLGVERRREIMIEYEKEMNRVLIEHQEQYRSQKIRLENECAELQQEVENMKVLCMMNIEKLNYNYAVLKRREDENKIVKNQQKRRLNKLQDTINELRKNCAELEDNTRLKIDKLQDQFMKAHKNIHDLQQKSNHFTAVNDKRYMEIWEMNTKKADKLLDEILKVDKIMHEQVLGLEWEPPEKSLLRKEDLPSYREALSKIEKRNGNTEQLTSAKLCNLRDTQSSPETINLEKKMLSHILYQISDQTGFMIEDKLREYLSTYSRINQTIIRLDNVFHALNIQSKDQIYLLLDYLLPYSYCPSCESAEKELISPSIDSSNGKLHTYTTDNAICPCNTDDLDGPTARLMQEILKHVSPESKGADENDGESGESNDESSQSPRELLLDDEIPIDTKTIESQETHSGKRKLTCDKGHLLEIQSENVVKALREFVEKFNEIDKIENFPMSDAGKKLDNNISLSRCISEKDMTEYWERYREIFSPEKEKLWDALMIGLNKYHEVLKERHKMMTENEAARQQNEELRRLLETCKVKSSSYPRRVTRSANNKTA